MDVKERGLFRNLEFSGLDHFPGIIDQMIHIKTPVKFSQVNIYFGRNILDLIHFFTQEAIYL